MGPEGGGGEVVGIGTPEDIADNRRSKHRQVPEAGHGAPLGETETPGATGCGVIRRPQPCSLLRGPVCAVGSIDRRNTLGELLRWRLIEQGLSRSLVELPRYGVELGLAV